MVMTTRCVYMHTISLHIPDHHVFGECKTGRCLEGGATVLGWISDHTHNKRFKGCQQSPSPSHFCFEYLLDELCLCVISRSSSQLQAIVTTKRLERGREKKVVEQRANES